jgi:exopolyphosphatase/guanosine-5'-triphosphate,3'-diphosphate pyrophosphatase
MRLGVLDIGSNTVHLLVADVHPGGRPQATTSQRTVLRLMRYLEPDGAISEAGVQALVDAVAQARAVAQAENVVELLATATSAVREAANGAEVIARIEAALGQELQVLGGESEARFTFLAVRRWFGWSAGQILLFDIGGGSLEIAAGADELPDVAASVPLGAGRTTVEFLPHDPPGEEAVEVLREHARACSRPSPQAWPVSPGRTTSSARRRRSGRWRSSPATPRPGGAERADAAAARRAGLVDSAARAHPGIRPPGAAGHHRRPHLPDRRGRRRAAHGDDGARRRRARGEPWALREGVLLRYIESLSWQEPA